MGNASSVNDSPSAQAMGLIKAASVASRWKKTKRNSLGHTKVNLEAGQSHTSDEELEKVYRAFRANDAVLKTSNFIALVKAGNVNKYNTRAVEELEALLNPAKIPEELTCEDFKYCVRTFSESSPSKRGVSVTALVKFMTAHKLQSYSVEDFISNVILPQTRKARCSFASVLAGSTDDEPAAVAPVSTATHFVCFSRTHKQPFSRLVSSLALLEKSLQTGTTAVPTMYVWLDILSLNLHETTCDVLTGSPQRKWQLEEHTVIVDQVIAQAESFVLFLDPWLNPSTLIEGLCLCQIFLAQVHSKKPHILVDSAQKSVFAQKALIDSFESTHQILGMAKDLNNAAFISTAERTQWQAYMSGQLDRNNATNTRKLEAADVISKLLFRAFMEMGVDKYHLDSHAAVSDSTDADTHTMRLATLAKNTATLANDIKQYGTAVLMYRESLQHVQAQYGKDSKQAFCLQLQVLDAMEHAGKSTLTLHSLYEECLKLSKKYNGKLHSVTLELLMKYATNTEDMGNLQQAADQYKHCLESCNAAKGREHPMTVQAAFALASSLQQLDQLEDANFYFHQSVPYYDKLFGPSHEDTLMALGFFAELKEDLGSLRTSEDLFRKRLANANTKPQEDADVAMTYHDLAAFLTRHGQEYSEEVENNRLDEAVKHYREAIRIRTKLLGAHHDDTILSANNLAVVLQRLDRVDDAEMLLQTSIDNMQAGLSSSEPALNNRLALRIVSVMSNLAVIMLHNGKMDKSEKMFDQIVTRYQSNSKRTLVENTRFLKILRNFGNLLIMKSGDGKNTGGSLDKAVELYQQAMAIYRTYPGEECLFKSKCYMVSDLAICYDKLGESKRAHKQYRAAYALCQKHLGLLSTETIDVAQHFADFCLKDAPTMTAHTNRANTTKVNRKLEEARTMMQQLLDDLQRDNPNPNFLVDGGGRDVDTGYQQDIFDTANTLGLLCKSLGDDAEAERNYKLAQEGNAQLHGYDHESVLAVSNNLATLYTTMGKLEEAQVIYSQLLKGYKWLYGDISEQTLQCTSSRAKCELALGNLSQAYELFQDSVDGCNELNGEDGIETIRSIVDLAGCLSDMGRVTEAKAKYNMALEGLEKALGNDHPETKRVHDQLEKLMKNTVLGKPSSHKAVGDEVWDLIHKKHGKPNRLHINRSTAVDALLNESQHASFTPKVFRPSISPTTHKHATVGSILHETAVKLNRHCKKSKHRSSRSSHRHNKDPRKAESRRLGPKRVHTRVSNDAGANADADLSGHKRDKHISGPRATTFSGPKAVARSRSTQNVLRTDSEELTVPWNSQFIDSEEEEEEEEEFEEAKEDSGLEGEEEEEDIDDLLRDVLGFESLALT